MNLCDLPDEVLHLVFEATMDDRDRTRWSSSFVLPLLAVCRRLRHIALPVAYNTVNIYVDGRCAPTDVPFSKVLPSLDQAASAGYAQCVKRLVITVRYEDSSIDGLRAATGRLRAAAGKLAGAVTLSLHMFSKKRMLGWDGADAADHEADIQAICNAITAAMPGVRRLSLTLRSSSSVSQEVSRRLAVHYSGQLKDLSIAGPVAISRGTEFKQLWHLELDYSHINTTRAPRVNPAELKLLCLRGRLTTSAWASFATGVRNRELTFANLKTLYLLSSPSAAMPSFAAQPHSRAAWRLHFPSLQRASIYCSQGPLPVLEWVVFPPRMALLTIDVAPAALQVVDEVVNIPAARRFALRVPRRFGDDPATLAMARRVLEKAHRCKTRELVVYDKASPMLVDMVVSAPITHLTLHMASMDVVTDLIRRASSITTLNIIQLDTDGAQPEILVPPPGSGRTVEPLSTTITVLRLGWTSFKWKPDAAPAAKYLLLAIPSLLRFTVADALRRQVAEFIEAHSACYPHLPSIAIRAWR